MKKYLHIPLALLLIALGIWGCTVTRTRTLASCLPEGQWSSFSCRERVLDLTPAQLQERMADTVVTHQAEFKTSKTGSLTLLIWADNATFLVELSDDGGISVADYNRQEKTRTYWHNDGAALYARLTESDTQQSAEAGT